MNGIIEFLLTTLVVISYLLFIAKIQDMNDIMKLNRISKILVGVGYILMVLIGSAITIIW